MKLDEAFLKAFALKRITDPDPRKVNFIHRLSWRRKVFRLELPLKGKPPFVFFACFNKKRSEIEWVKQQYTPFRLMDVVYRVSDFTLQKYRFLAEFPEPVTREEVIVKVNALKRGETWLFDRMFKWKLAWKAGSAIILHEKSKRVLWVATASLRREKDVTANDRKAMVNQPGFKKQRRKAIYAVRKRPTHRRQPMGRGSNRKPLHPRRGRGI